MVGVYRAILGTSWREDNACKMLNINCLIPTVKHLEGMYVFSVQMDIISIKKDVWKFLIFAQYIVRKMVDACPVLRAMNLEITNVCYLNKWSIQGVPLSRIMNVSNVLRDITLTLRDNVQK